MKVNFHDSNPFHLFKLAIYSKQIKTLYPTSFQTTVLYHLNYTMKSQLKKDFYQNIRHFTNSFQYQKFVQIIVSPIHNSQASAGLPHALTLLSSFPYICSTTIPSLPYTVLSNDTTNNTQLPLSPCKAIILQPGQLLAAAKAATQTAAKNNQFWAN